MIDVARNKLTLYFFGLFDILVKGCLKKGFQKLTQNSNVSIIELAVIQENNCINLK
jgi:hypothetical protein